MDAAIVQQTVAQIIEGTDLYIVHVAVTSGGRIVVEIDKDQGIGIDECVYVNRQLVERLAPDIEQYDLEVSSPGLTEPFRITRQYVKHIGDDIAVVKVDGTRLRGVLVEATDEHILLRTTVSVKKPDQKKKTTETVEQDIPRQDIKSAKIILQFK